MFSEKIPDLRNSLSFRLAVFYAVIFSISSLLSLSFFYYRVSAITMNRVDAELRGELTELTEIIQNEGREQVLAEMAKEIDSDDAKTVFYQLLSNDGGVIALEATPSIRALPPSDQGLVFPPTTNSLPGFPYKTRVISGNIDPETILQIGFSLKENEAYLRVFRHLIFSLALPLILISTLIGWIMGSQAIRGLGEVTRTATAIAAGDYDKRVVVKKRSVEIDLMATAFNKMVDRLQALIKGTYEMTDNIAHDLRSPLTRIRGIAEMTLLGEKSLPEFHEMAVSTVEECDNLMGLINTMLDITETETGVGAKAAKEELNINTLVLDACALFQSVADEKQIGVEVNTPEECTMPGDRNRTQQIITNLLDNAIKYTEAGGKVTVSVTNLGNSIRIIFADTGVGIPAEELSKIFQRFYRCDHSRTQPGTGLGLSLVKAIVESVGGEINTTSTLGQGSVFTVDLPV